MANYLARVAAAGARTTTPVRPPVSAPPLMPGPGMFDPAWPGQVEAEVTLPNTPETVRQAEVRPAPLSPTPEATFDRTQAPDPLAANPLPTAPLSAPAADLAVTQSVEAPIPQPRPAVSSSSRVEPAQEFERPLVGEIIRVPKALRAAPITTTVGPAPIAVPPMEANVHERESLPANPSIPAMQSTGELGLTVAHQQAASELAKHSPNLATSVEIPVVTQSERASNLDAALSSALTQSPARSLAELPLPPAQPGPPEPPTVTQRPSRITIGRLDVQVINPPPPPAARPARPPSPPDRDILAGLYLDRFRLMP